MTTSSEEKNNNIKPTIEKWVNIPEVADYLSVSTDTVRAWIKDEKIPYCRAGKQYKFLLSEVEACLRAGKLE